MTKPLGKKFADKLKQNEKWHATRTLKFPSEISFGPVRKEKRLKEIKRKKKKKRKENRTRLLCHIFFSALFILSLSLFTSYVLV